MSEIIITIYDDQGNEVESRSFSHVDTLAEMAEFVGGRTYKMERA